MRKKKQLPSSPQEWLEEIAEGYLDASGVIPFAPLVDQEITPDNLFHLGPALCFKFRGMEPTPEELESVTKTVLSSYIVTEENTPGIFSAPEFAFAFCYLSSHFVCDIIDEETAYALIEYVEDNLKELKWLCGED